MNSAHSPDDEFSAPSWRLSKIGAATMPLSSPSISDLISLEKPPDFVTPLLRAAAGGRLEIGTCQIRRLFTAMYAFAGRAPAALHQKSNRPLHCLSASDPPLLYRQQLY